MSYLFFSSSRFNIDTLATGFVVMGLLAMIALITLAFIFGESSITNLMVEAQGLGTQTLGLIATAVTNAAPLVASGVQNVASLAFKGASLVDSFVESAASKIFSALLQIFTTLSSMAATAGSNLLSIARTVGIQAGQLFLTGIQTAANAAANFLQLFVEAVKGWFIPVI